MRKVNKKKLRSEYNLYLQDDSYSDGSTCQWYYFAAMNVKKGTTVKMNILNLTKGDSLYGKGQRPFVYSTTKAAKKSVGWHHAGDNIKYMDNRKQ